MINAGKPVCHPEGGSAMDCGPGSLPKARFEICGMFSSGEKETQAWAKKTSTLQFPTTGWQFSFLDCSTELAKVPVSARDDYVFISQEQCVRVGNTFRIIALGFS